MIYLPDVNIWIALTSDRHIHHPVATEWFRSIDADTIAFCRVTELGFLRLLTNAHVMGRDVLSPGHAWRTYDAWRTDDRVVFLSEQANFTEHWRRLGSQITGGANAWTDAYLATFAAHVDLTVVTLDRQFSHFGEVTVTVLL
jgi:toxin-antitoxin system PIN domain toxin